MPSVSQAQRRWAFANKDKPGKEGKAAREYANSDPGGKLPETAEIGRRHAKLYDHPRSRKAATG